MAGVRYGLCLAVLCWAVSAWSDDRVAFVGVALDQETRQADRKLQDYLQRSTGLHFAPEELEYGEVIERLSNWDPGDGVVLARTTPYVQVVSEMLGAEMEVIATYVGETTGSTTYSSYFVVRRDDLPESATASDVIDFVAEHPDRARFTYHNLFSTSSFFLPALHFRMNGVFHMSEPTESLAAIEVAPISSDSSSALVRAVAAGEADLAAVWDGTRARFISESASPADRAVGEAVVFVRLPSAIPNDLLVCSRWAPDETKERLRAAIREMTAAEIAVGDFARWIDIIEAPEARTALADLRWLAREQVSRVTVDVRAANDHPQTAMMASSARHAVRLSGTEFVLFDEDFHERIDFVWTLEEIHDGATRLTSAIPGTAIKDQVFSISFRDGQDLTRRVVNLVHGRLHRIRYVWPYSGLRPRVIRDSTLALPAGTVAPTQRVTWLDLKRNSFRSGPVFPVRVTDSDVFTHELAGEDFWPAAGSSAELDPMSNVSYRVYMLRVLPSNLWFRIATGALIVFLALAAISAVVAFKRRQRPTTDNDAKTVVT
jgi:ABC-type phosphate/phosphonate transport system substrate-binding protein